MNRSILILLVILGAGIFIAGAQEGFAMAEKSKKPDVKKGTQCGFPQSEAELKKLLTPEQYRVMRENGTEAPFLNDLWNNHKPGIYVDRISGEPLFASIDKFDSGTGWPSFFAPFDPTHVRVLRDTSHGMVRDEIVCARCDSHLGHVFPDGPPPTGERHCLNSVSLAFTRNGDPLPDVLGRGGPESQPAA